MNTSRDITTYSDQELVDLTLDEDKEYFSELVKRYYPKIIRYAARLLNHHPHDVEECVSETFLKASVHLDTYSPRASFSTWIYRIAHNQAVDYIRSNAKHSFVEINEDHISYDPTTIYEHKDMLEKILRTLNLEDRNLLTLFYLEGLSLNEISDILKLRSNTIAVKIKRIKEKVRKMQH